jgi:hypothetical protein
MGLTLTYAYLALGVNAVFKHTTVAEYEERMAKGMPPSIVKNVSEQLQLIAECGNYVEGEGIIRGRDVSFPILHRQKPRRNINFDRLTDH